MRDALERASRAGLPAPVLAAKIADFAVTDTGGDYVFFFKLRD